MKFLDLNNLSDLKIAMTRAAELGAQHQSIGHNHHPTAKELMMWLPAKYREGHKRFIKSAYEAGRFTVKVN